MVYACCTVFLFVWPFGQSAEMKNQPANKTRQNPSKPSATSLVILQDLPSLPHTPATICFSSLQTIEVFILFRVLVLISQKARVYSTLARSRRTYLKYQVVFVLLHLLRVLLPVFLASSTGGSFTLGRDRTGYGGGTEVCRLEITKHSC